MANVAWTVVRLLGLITLLWSEVGLVRTAAQSGKSGLAWLLLYWVGASVVLWVNYKLLDNFATVDIARIVKPLVASFLFFPLWIFWGFAPLPFAFFMVFPTGAAAPAILLISLVWVPFGVVVLLLSRSLWRSFRAGTKSLFRREVSPSVDPNST